MKPKGEDRWRGNKTKSNLEYTSSTSAVFWLMWEKVVQIEALTWGEESFINSVMANSPCSSRSQTALPYINYMSICTMNDKRDKKWGRGMILTSRLVATPFVSRSRRDLVKSSKNLAAWYRTMLSLSFSPTTTNCSILSHAPLEIKIKNASRAKRTEGQRKTKKKIVMKGRHTIIYRNNSWRVSLAHAEPQRGCSEHLVGTQHAAKPRGGERGGW